MKTPKQIAAMRSLASFHRSVAQKHRAAAEVAEGYAAKMDAEADEAEGQQRATTDAPVACLTQAAARLFRSEVRS